ncbi:MAG: aminoacyl-tRNA hydrolase [Bacteroidota bacterium]
MDAIKLEGQPRATGTSAARAVRRDGQVPCVLYGAHAEPVSFKVPELDLHPLIYTDETHIVTVEVGDENWSCIMKDVDFHPTTDKPIHADFQVLTAGESITITVPVQFHGTPVGQTEGGDTQYVVTEINVRCLPKDIPSHIDVDVAHLNIGDAIHVADLDLPELDFLTPVAQTLVTVVAPRLAGIEVEEEGLLLDEEEIVDTAEGPAGGEEADTEGELQALLFFKKRREAMASPTRLVIGLGNPGVEYVRTRHNIGFEVVDAVAERVKATPFKHDRGNTLTAVGRHRGHTFLLAKPLTFMNRSGSAVRKLLNLHGLRDDDLLVVHDDIHLEVGRLRLRPGGSAGGHNGVQDIIDAIGTREFPRLKFGVGSEFHRGGQSHYVLSPFSEEQRLAADEGLDKAVDAVLTFVADGILSAMNRHN